MRWMPGNIFSLYKRSFATKLQKLCPTTRAFFDEVASKAACAQLCRMLYIQREHGLPAAADAGEHGHEIWRRWSKKKPT